MNALRTRLGLDDEDRGLGLVEVVVAMMIFAIISTGSIYTLLSVLQTTRESRSGQVAANLAAQEIDLARDVDDLFGLLDNTRVVELNGDTFTIKRSTNWVSDNGDLQCGTGGGALRYKRVNVEVRWANMRNADRPVRSDTVIDPSDRVNDPTLGTILVSVNNGSGTGSPLVKVTAVPDVANPDGAQNLSVAPSATDPQGCSYILKVKPGNYDVSVSKAGFVSNEQDLTPSEDVTVVAGEAASVGFQFDQKSTLQLTFLQNYVGPFKVPTDLKATFISSYGAQTLAVPADKRVSLHPFSLGYQVVPGQFEPKTDSSGGCLSPDPESWPDKQEGAFVRSASRQPAVAAAPGGSAPAPVAMGVVRIQTGLIASAANGYVLAVSATGQSSTGDPGCSTQMAYNFGPVLPLLGGTTELALPYGSWKIYTGSLAAQGVVSGSKMQIVSGQPHPIVSNVVTLDPRDILTPGTGGCVEDGNNGKGNGGECGGKDEDD